MSELRTGLWRPTLEDENGKPLADLGLLAKPARLAIVPWLLVFFIEDWPPVHSHQPNLDREPACAGD